MNHQEEKKGITRARRPRWFFFAGICVVGTLIGASVWAKDATRDGYDESFRGSRVSWARLKFRVGGRSGWRAHPSGDVNMIHHIRNSTNINISRNWDVADIDDLERLTSYPFIFAHAQENFYLNAKHRKNLGEYLKRGGFLFIDDCVLNHYSAPDVFYKAMERELKIILPDARWETLENDHEVFHNVFDLPNGLPHMQGRARPLKALYHKKRVVAMICSSDIHCGWVNVGWFPGREHLAAKMGVNIYVYAITH